MFCVLFLSMYLVVDQLGRLPTSQEIFKVEVTCIRGRSRASISPAFINSLLGKLNILEALISFSVKKIYAPATVSPVEQTLNL